MYKPVLDPSCMHQIQHVRKFATINVGLFSRAMTRQSGARIAPSPIPDRDRL